MTFLRSRRALLLGAPVLLLATGTAGAAWMMRVPSDLDLSRVMATEAGPYIAANAPVEEPVTAGLLHAWIVTVEDRDGAPVDDAHITIGGGMPQHGHGLPPLPSDPSNRVADEPRAAELGRALFFDTRFSANGEVACATCHLPERQFQDDLPLGQGVGTTGRRTMPITTRSGRTPTWGNSRRWRSCLWA